MGLSKFDTRHIAQYYGGGPLPPHTGDYLVSRGVKIVTAYGATELGIVVRLSVPAEDWLYVEFSERCNIRWVPQGEKSFEAQFLVKISSSLYYSHNVDYLFTDY